MSSTEWDSTPPIAPYANYFVLTVPFTGARAAHHLSEKAVCFHRPASSGTVSIESLFSNSTVCWLFCFVLHISIFPRSLGALTIASFFKCDKPIKHSYEKGWWGYCAQTVIQHSQLNLIESFPRRSKLTLSSSVAQTERYWMSYNHV